MATIINSVSTVIGLLKSSNATVQYKALQRLNSFVESHWSEIADDITLLQEIYQNKKNPANVCQLSAYISSQVYYHLGQYQDSLNLALQAPSHFNISEKTQFVQTLVYKCIDKYIQIQQNNYSVKSKSSANDDPSAIKQEGAANLIPIPPKYEEIVVTIFKIAVGEKDYKQALGLAFQTRRLDFLQEIFQTQYQDSRTTEFLRTAFQRAVSNLEERRFRNEVLRLIGENYSTKENLKFTPLDFVNISLINFYLNDHEGISKILYELISDTTSQEASLIAYQIAYEIADNENQGFIDRIINSIPIDTSEEKTKKRENLVKILSNKLRDDLYGNFLTKFSQVDPIMLTKMKDGSDPQKCIQLIGIILAQGILNAYTGDDKFLIDQKEWLNQANLWNKFMIISSLGLIHHGTKKDPEIFLSPFIPQSENDPVADQQYENGGALYGLGLYNFGEKNQNLIENCTALIRNHSYNSKQVIVHGAALAIGMTGLASQDFACKEVLMDVLNMNNAVTGEAAGIAVGLLMAGSGDSLTLEELHRFAKQSEHEKIIRSIALGSAIINFGKARLADTFIDTLLKENEPMLRYGSCLSIGMAYVGTNNNAAIRKLLKISAQDVSDDVRRAAVISLAFVMFSNPEQIPQIIRLLNTSYNPHVRYGAALSLGIGCAGTCNAEAINMLEGLLKDPVDFVRQAAFIGYSLVVQNYNSKFESNVEGLRKKLEQSSFKQSGGSFIDEIIKMAKDMSQTQLSQVGAKIGLAIIEAGGRNIGVSLSSSNGFPKLGACVSMLIFSHFWFWYPLALFLPLAMAPKAIIGVDQEFWIPVNFQVQCNAKKSLFDYPANMKTDENKKEKPDGPVKLSTTNKVSRRRKNKGGGLADGNQDSVIDQTNTSKTHPTKSIIQTSFINPPEQKVDKPVVPEEPNSYIINNPARVLEKQQRFIQYVENRYTPIITDRQSGIVFLKDSEKGQFDEYLNGTQGEQMLVEPQAPEDFVFDDEKQKLI